MKRSTAVIALAAAALLASCAGEPQGPPVAHTGVQSGPRFALELEPGPYYAKEVRVLWYTYTVWPQVAVWVETPQGEYIDTLYVTAAAATGRYRAAPRDGRPEALPVWSHLDKARLDAVSSPTTVGGAVRYGNDIAARLPAGAYVVKLETNRSYDWNAAYTRKNAGVNGQPSLVYQADIEIGTGSREALFRPIGHGSVDGKDGRMLPGLEGIDTALGLFSSLKISYLAE